MPPISVAGGTISSGCERDVDREAERAARRSGSHTDALRTEREERREQQAVDADAGLHRAVDEQQRRRPAAALAARDERARQRAEHPVAEREPAQEQPEHGRGRLAVRAEQDLRGTSAR